MSSELTLSSQNSVASTDQKEDTKQFVTMQIDGQLFGIPVFNVQDVLRPQNITKTPLAPHEILGSINLRGRIVTVVSMRRRLGLESPSNPENYMQVVVEYNNELYSLIIDSVGEVLNLKMSDFESNPANLDSRWQNYSMGVYRLKDRLMVVLDIESILKFV